MRNKFKILVLSIVVMLAFPAFAVDEIHWMNGWDQSCYPNGVNTCRKDWYKTPQGSHLLKWEVFLNIEEESSTKLFSSRESLSKYGFLYPEQAPYSTAYQSYDGSPGERVEQNLTQYGLPLGFVKDKNDLNNRNYLGLTCAACHTGKITYGDNTYYVEAGQANADMIELLRNLKSALHANRYDSSKLSRFKRRFFQYVMKNRDFSAWPVSALSAKSYLDSALKYVSNYEQRNQVLVENGPGRLDAIGAILNQVHIDHAGRDLSLATRLTAPVSYPYIWNASSLECVQTNCLGTDPITRNAGEVLGVFGYSNIDDDKNIPDILELLGMQLGLNTLFDGTPKIDNLYQLEQTLNKVSPPTWPTSFPQLNDSLVSHGEAVYAENCAACHMNTTDGVSQAELTAPNSIGRQFTKVTRVHHTDVGTDEAFAADYGLRKERSGIIGSVLVNQRPDSVDPETGIKFKDGFPDYFNALVLLGVNTQVIVANHQDTAGFKIKAAQAYPNLSLSDAVDALVIDYAAGNIDQQPLTPTSYRAKPLDGIAFTGPFLHNGSVRTLKDLLAKPEDRATSFLVGSTDFDTDGVGYISAGDFLLDTSIRGNSKKGHVYGTDLPSYDKEALLEFMKTL
jgi:cytochrome c553